MAHNSFDIVPNHLGQGFLAKSHNFPGVSGAGETPTEAIQALNRAVIYHLDNTPNALKLSITNRKALNQACLCGKAGKFSEALAIKSSVGWQPIQTKRVKRGHY